MELRNSASHGKTQYSTQDKKHPLPKLKSKAWHGVNPVRSSEQVVAPLDRFCQDVCKERERRHEMEISQSESM